MICTADGRARGIQLPRGVKPMTVTAESGVDEGAEIDGAASRSRKRVFTGSSSMKSSLPVRHQFSESWMQFVQEERRERAAG